MKLFTTRNLLNAAVFATAAVTGLSATAANLTTSGNINTAANWDTGVLPGPGETGNVNIDASWPATSAFGTVTIAGDLIFGGGSTLTAGVDVVGSTPNSVTFNAVTVNATDDIFTGGAGGNFIFNAGAITNVGDDFEANAGGTITVNGGTHNVGDQFGAQRGSVLNFLGGNVITNGFRATAGNAGTPAGGTINVGGDATLNASGALALDSSGFIEFSNAWAGSLTVSTLTGTDWQTALDGTTATFEGGAIDATVFATNFQITNGGQTLSLINPVPEPGSLALLGLGGLLIARRRRA